MFLVLSAFLLPVYFIFYPELNNTADRFTKILWKAVIAGFCFYGIAAIIFTLY